MFLDTFTIAGAIVAVILIVAGYFVIRLMQREPARE